jgi:hypothetical protein
MGIVEREKWPGALAKARDNGEKKAGHQPRCYPLRASAKRKPWKLLEFHLLFLEHMNGSSFTGHGQSRSFVKDSLSPKYSA